MTVGKLSIEEMGNDNILAVINCDNGDHYELAGVTRCSIRHRAEDFCQRNQIVLKQVPSDFSVRIGFKDVLQSYRF